MKLKYYLVSLVLLAGTSCNDGFSWIVPRRSIVWCLFLERSPKDATQYTTGTYRYLIAPENHIIMTDCYTDNAVPVHVGAEQDSYPQEQRLPPTLTSNKYGRGLRHYLPMRVYMANILKQGWKWTSEKPSLRGGIAHEPSSIQRWWKYFGGIAILTQLHLS